MGSETRAGLLYAGGAFLFWGLTPVFWKLLRVVPALELLAHRIVWALVVMVVWMTIRRRWPELGRVLRRPRTIASLLASTTCIACNWGLFIYAVNSDRVLSTSLGYPLIMFTLGARRLPLATIGLLQYLAPSCTFLLAVFVYGEAFSLAHAVAFGLIWTALALYTWDLRTRLRRSIPPPAKYHDLGARRA